MEEQKKDKLYLILQIAVAVLLFFGFFRLMIVIDISLATADLVVAFIFFAMAFILKIKKNSYNVISMLFIMIVFLLTSYTMSITDYGSRFMWLSTIIVVAFYFRDKKEGLYWTVFFVIAALLPEILINGHFTAVYLVSYATIIVNIALLAVIISWYEGIKEREREHYENQQKILEREIEKAVLKLREKDSFILKQSKVTATTDIMKKIAHHWRQPLNVISLIFSAIEVEGENNKKQQELIQNGQKAVDELSKTIDEFRELFSEKENEEDFILSESVDKALKIVSGAILEKNIQLTFENYENYKVRGFANDLTQVFITLIENSIEAMDRAQIAGRFIKINIFESDGFAVVKIEDNGGGINETIKDKIFEPYFSTKMQTSGTGINLFVAKQTVEKNMRGKILAYNGENGAIFEIRLPLI